MCHDRPMLNIVEKDLAAAEQNSWLPSFPWFNTVRCSEPTAPQTRLETTSATAFAETPSSSNKPAFGCKPPPPSHRSKPSRHCLLPNRHDNQLHLETSHPHSQNHTKKHNAPQPNPKLKTQLYAEKHGSSLFSVDYLAWCAHLDTATIWTDINKGT